jgi:autotransporter-associated beta strand protein
LTAINATGVTQAGTSVINIIGNNLVVGTYPLIATGGSVPTTGFSLGALPTGVTAHLDNSGTSLDLVITSTGQTLTWYGADSGGNPLTTWDINTSMNWNSGGAKYLQYGGNTYGDNVVFDDSVFSAANANVTLNTAVVPASVRFNNSSTPYSVTGSGGIGGATSLVLANNGSVFLGTSNSYSGGTVVNGGTLAVANDNALGAASAPLTLAGATLQISNTTASTRSISIPTNSTIDVAAGATAQFSGVISGTAGLTKADNGTLKLSGSNNALGGPLSVNGGSLTITGGTNAFSGGTSYIGYLTGSGDLSMTGGRLAVGGELRVGGSDQSGVGINAIGTVTLSNATLSVGALSVARGNSADNTVSGTVTLNSGSTLNSEGDVLLDFAGGGTGKLVVNGGILNLATTTKRWLIVNEWDSGSAELDVNSGQVNINAGTDIRFATQGNTGTNVFNLNGGAVTFHSDNHTTVGGSGVVDLHQGNGATVDNTFNLNGGVLTVSGILSANTSGSRTFNFNGGTLRADAANISFVYLGVGTTAANIRNGGAIIDSAGFDVIIPQILQHSTISGDNSVDGGLTKLGTGTLTLSAANTYNGNTRVGGGILELAQATLAASSTVSISNGAQLKLDFPGTNQVSALVLNGLSQAAGVYNSATASPYITGSGSLLVQAIASNPTNISFTVSSGSLQLSWPADHRGWILQMSTNIAPATWIDVPGSASVTSTNIVPSPAIPAEFFRLRHP